MRYSPYPPKVLPLPKYRIGTYFRHIDTEVIFKLIEVKQDTYILQSGPKAPQVGESEFTLDYDYEILPEGEVLFHGKKEKG